METQSPGNGSLSNSQLPVSVPLFVPLYLFTQEIVLPHWVVSITMGWNGIVWCYYFEIYVTYFLNTLANFELKEMFTQILNKRKVFKGVGIWQSFKF